MNGMEGHATNLVPIDSIATNTPQFYGEVVGNAAAAAGELQLVEQGVSYSTKYLVKDGIKSVSWLIMGIMSPGCLLHYQRQCRSSSITLTTQLPWSS
jgi:hypothetical protein